LLFYIFIGVFVFVLVLIITAMAQPPNKLVEHFTRPKGTPSPASKKPASATPPPPPKG
jgi:hypothetical protein